METAFIVLVGAIVLAIIFDFVNGFHDASNIVATMIASRSLSPEAALIIASVCEFLGPLLLGTAVAKTIGKGMVDPEAINVFVISAALLGAIVWNLLTWWLGLPSSSSHALVGGLAGAVIIGAGLDKLHLEGFLKIVLMLVVSPLIGFGVGFSLQKLFKYGARGATPGANEFFKRTQIFSSIALALSHGANDAQKSMGIITMILVASTASPGVIPDWASFLRTTEFIVPTWVIVACAAAIALGTATGGWSIIKTVGSGIFKLQPIHSFSAQSTSAVVIFGSAALGFPVSTTHIVSSGIMGVGSAERIKAVKWHKAKEIVTTWFITIPASAIIAALIYLGIDLLRKVF